MPGTEIAYGGTRRTAAGTEIPSTPEWMDEQFHLELDEEGEREREKEARKLRKKLKQTWQLQQQLESGQTLNANQQEKLAGCGPFKCGVRYCDRQCA
eukprot:3451731-Rhodomonas_salina.1